MKRLIITALCLAWLAGMAAALGDPWNPNYYDGTFRGHGDFVPKGNGVWDLGDPGNHWHKAYVDSLLGAALIGYADSSHRADSLKYGAGYFAGTSYLRSDVPDTLDGQLWLNNVSLTDDPGGVIQYVLGWNPVSAKLEAGTIVPSATNATNATNLLVSGVAKPGASFLRSDARDTATASIIFNTGGRLAMYSDSAGQAVVNITLRDDSAKGIYLTPGDQLPSAQASLLFLTGNSKAHPVGGYTDWTRYGEIGYGNNAIGYYGDDSTTGIYLDITGTNAKGIYDELNFASTNSTTGIYHILDYVGGGRGICEKFYDQGSGGTHPMIILTGDGTADSTMLYRNKIKVDTTITEHLKVGSFLVDSASGRDSGKVAIRDSIRTKSLLPLTSNTGSIGASGNAFDAGYFDTLTTGYLLPTSGTCYLGYSTYSLAIPNNASLTLLGSTDRDIAISTSGTSGDISISNATNGLYLLGSGTAGTARLTLRNVGSYITADTILGNRWVEARNTTAGVTINNRASLRAGNVNPTLFFSDSTASAARRVDSLSYALNAFTFSDSVVSANGFIGPLWGKANNTDSVGGNFPDFSVALMADSLAVKAPLASPIFTGRDSGVVAIRDTIRVNHLAIAKDTCLEVALFERTCTRDTLAFMTGADSLTCAFIVSPFGTRGAITVMPYIAGVVGGKLVVDRPAADTASYDRYSVTKIKQR